MNIRQACKIVDGGFRSKRWVKNYVKHCFKDGWLKEKGETYQIDIYSTHSLQERKAIKVINKFFKNYK